MPNLVTSSSILGKCQNNVFGKDPLLYCNGLKLTASALQHTVGRSENLKGQAITKSLFQGKVLFLICLNLEGQMPPWSPVSNGPFEEPPFKTPKGMPMIIWIVKRFFSAISHSLEGPAKQRRWRSWVIYWTIIPWHALVFTHQMCYLHKWK